jgi:hypothetical protein
VPERTVLHQVVREHLETFLAEARLRGGGEGLPPFVERELREFLTCGGRLRLLATIEDKPARGFRRAGRVVVEKILTHLGLPADPPCPSPARPPEWLPGVRRAADATLRSAA